MFYSKRIVLSLVLLLKTLEMISQSPRFSFSSDIIVLETSTNTEKIQFKVYKGEYTSVTEVLHKKDIIGSFSNNEGEIRFTPLLPFQKGGDYTVLFKNELYPFKIQLEASYERLEIETIYPNAEVLPANFLKWYIRFSKPVNPSNIYDHLHLISNENGAEVDRALLPLETPLLSDDGTLLTLWIEPGRQKRDLGPNRLLGKVLVENTVYTLVIDKDLKDREGISIGVAYQHSFKVREADRTQPFITSWDVEVPEVNTEAPLRINFNEFLDYVSLINSLDIQDSSGKSLEGDFTIKANQKFALFVPSQEWNKGSYKVHCKPFIEDLAGNNLERLFDQDITVEKGEPVLELFFVVE